MMTARLRQSCDGVVTISYGILYVEDADGSLVEDDMAFGTEADFAANRYLTEGVGFVRIRSAENVVLARVELQSWGNEPSAESAEWEMCGNAHLVLGSGDATVRCLDGDSLHSAVHVGEAGVPCQVRVHSRGHQRLRDLRAAGQDYDIDEVQEEYLIQLWST